VLMLGKTGVGKSTLLRNLLIGGPVATEPKVRFSKAGSSPRASGP